jgi:hypothetical protein
MQAEKANDFFEDKPLAENDPNHLPPLLRKANSVGVP